MTADNITGFPGAELDFSGTDVLLEPLVFRVLTGGSEHKARMYVELGLGYLIANGDATSNVGPGSVGIDAEGLTLAGGLGVEFLAGETFTVQIGAEVRAGMLDATIEGVPGEGEFDSTEIGGVFMLGSRF